MDEMIKIGIDTRTGNPIVNARYLYEFLEVKQKFADWIKDRIKKFNFIENQDYACSYFDVQGNEIALPKNRKLLSQGIQAHKIEYALTLDMAKELSMLQNNERGSDARKYFIKVEKKYQQLKLKTSDTKEPILELDNESRPYTYGKAAKKINWGKNKMLDELRLRRIIEQNNVPRLPYVQKGFFLYDFNEKYKYIKQARVTEKGCMWLNQILNFNPELQINEAPVQEPQQQLVTVNEDNEKVDSLYKVVRAIGALLYTNQEGSNLSPKRQAAILALNAAMHNADEIFKIQKCLDKL